MTAKADQVLPPPSYERTIREYVVVDGDTVHAEVSLGLDQYCWMTLRLAGVNCPEISTPEGKAAASFTQEWLDTHRRIGAWLVLRTLKDKREKYGRYLADIIGGTAPGSQSLCNALLASGHAASYWP